MSAVEKFLVGTALAILVMTSLSYVLWKSLVYRLDRTVIIPAYPWRISGRVFDTRTNPLGNTTITIAGMPRVTGSDRLAERGPTPFTITTNTDKEGAFVFNFQAAAFHMKISKPGYAEQILDVVPRVKGPPINTNRVLDVYLEPSSRPRVGP